MSPRRDKLKSTEFIVCHVNPARRRVAFDQKPRGRMKMKGNENNGDQTTHTVSEQSYNREEL
jgi:hypothetical protein